MMNRALALPALLFLVLLPLLPAKAQPREDVATLSAQIKSLRDDVDPEVIGQLAALRTRESAEALIEAYDSFGSIFMRREVVRALGAFDGVADAEQPAMQKVSDVATTSKEPELRMAAIETLAESKSLGKHFLANIVQSPVSDGMRESAMKAHMKLADDSDKEWYEELYNPKTKQDDKKKKKKKGDDEEEERVLHQLDTLRALAFTHLSGGMKRGEILEAAEDRYYGVRQAALRALAKAQDKDTDKVARGVFERNDERSDNRVLAAQILAELEGPKVMKEFIDVGQKVITPLDLRMAMADLLAEMKDEKTNKTLAKLVGKGKAYEKLFSIRGARLIEDPKVDKALRKLLKDKDTDVAIMAAQVIGERKDAEALEPLMKLLEKTDDPEQAAQVIDAIGSIRASDAEWEAELVSYLDSPLTNVRNAALIQLGRLKKGEYRERMEGFLSHGDWSTRLATLKGLEALRDKRSLPAILARAPEETGRMGFEFADVLFNLTGQPFRTAWGSWASWWDKEGAGFELISASELDKRRKEEEERRLRQTTASSFFGIRIISHRVIFIIDVSGSMNEEVRTEFVGDGILDRMTVAKRELIKCIDGLDKAALFNIITFSSGVEAWVDEGIAGADGTKREEGKEFVDRLGAGGATNLYDSLRLAFDDPDVDTIFVLSDGEPTSGEETEPGVIREHVRIWNEHRDIKINTIAVGGELQILEWLAEDTGGDHVKFQ